MGNCKRCPPQCLKLRVCSAVACVNVMGAGWTGRLAGCLGFCWNVWNAGASVIASYGRCCLSRGGQNGLGPAPLRPLVFVFFFFFHVPDINGFGSRIATCHRIPVGAPAAQLATLARRPPRHASSPARPIPRRAHTTRSHGPQATGKPGNAVASTHLLGNVSHEMRVFRQRGRERGFFPPLLPRITHAGCRIGRESEREREMQLVSHPILPLPPRPRPRLPGRVGRQ